MSDMKFSIIGLVLLLVMIVIYVVLIMVIWNNVIVKKFPLSDIQQLDFWDALALAVFCSLLFGPRTVINYN